MGSVAQNGQESALLAALERAIRFVGAHHPGCGIAELALPVPLSPAEDYLDEYHPGPRGLDKLAAGMAALLSQEAARRRAGTP